jgi:hypothetical protein
METAILALLIIGLSLAGLGLGSLLGRGPVKGSCAGLSCIKGADCDACPNRSEREAGP